MSSGPDIEISDQIDLGLAGAQTAEFGRCIVGVKESSNRIAAFDTKVVTGKQGANYGYSD
ncbi:hypothetical protein JCM12856_33020 [Spirochaeta dissipatitropha]